MQFLTQLLAFLPLLTPALSIPHDLARRDVPYDVGCYGVGGRPPASISNAIYMAQYLAGLHGTPCGRKNGQSCTQIANAGSTDTTIICGPYDNQSQPCDALGRAFLAGIDKCQDRGKGTVSVAVSFNNDGGKQIVYI